MASWVRDPALSPWLGFDPTPRCGQNKKIKKENIIKGQQREEKERSGMQKPRTISKACTDPLAWPQRGKE